MDNCKFTQDSSKRCQRLINNNLKLYPCICDRQHDARIDLIKQNMFEKFQESRLDDFTPQDEFQVEAKEMVQRFLSELGIIKSNLALVGNIGTGKTYLALSVFRHAVNRGILSKFLKWEDLVEIPESYSLRAEKETWRKSLLRYDLIVIDDLWKVPNRDSNLLSKQERVITTKLIKSLIDSGRIIVITSEFNGKEHEKIDASTWSRFYQKCNYGTGPKDRYYVELKGENMRYKKELAISHT